MKPTAQMPVDFSATLHDCDFAKIKIGLNVTQIFCGRGFLREIREQDIGVEWVFTPDGNFSLPFTELIGFGVGRA